ncbi:head GIN domain-containing protein [soil metagenome]
MSRFLAFALLAVTTVGCGISIWDGPSVAGSGVITSQSRSVHAFDRIDVGGQYDVVVTVGATRSVVLEGDDNLLPLVRTEVRGGTLHVESDNDLRPSREIRIEIVVETLRGIHSGGSSDVAVRDVRAPAFEASVSGSSELTANGQFGDLSTSISGSGEIHMNGTADAIDGKVSGSGELDLLQVRARAARIDVSGSGDAAVQVSERLDASVSGSGDVRYSGRPSVNADISGSGSVDRI